MFSAKWQSFSFELNVLNKQRLHQKFSDVLIFWNSNQILCYSMFCHSKISCNIYMYIYILPKQYAHDSLSCGLQMFDTRGPF